MRRGTKKSKPIFLIILLAIIVMLIAVYIGKDILFENETNMTKYDSSSEEKIDNQISQENISNDVSNNQNEITKENTDLFGKYYDKAEEILNNMTLEEKVGQMFLVRFPESGVISEIKDYNPGGYILFGRDDEEINFIDGEVVDFNWVSIEEYSELYKEGKIVPSGDFVIKFLKEKELEEER